MNILVLSNGAPNYHFFFNQLARRFAADGDCISIAVDSEFSRKNNALDKLDFPVFEFSFFFSRHKTDHELLRKYSRFNLNAALLSDFERAQVYGIWGNKDKDYFDRLKSALLAFFELIFEKYSIDIVLYENVSNTFAHFAFFVAQEIGAKYCGVGGARIPGRFSISSDPIRDNSAEQIFSHLRTGSLKLPKDIQTWCEEYLSNIDSIVPDYMKYNGLDNTSLVRRYFRKDRLSTFAALLRSQSNDSYHSFQIGNPLRTYVNLFRRNVLRRAKLLMLRDYYEVPVEGEAYLFYPMHFHPESSTSILAGTYLDEYEVIRNIAFNLPEGVKLYVKDHISAWGYPSLKFYRNLKRLPNVRVLAPTAPTKQIIKESKAVITLTSTVGFEALLLGKCVFLFGNVFYQYHKNVCKIQDPTRLFETLRDFMFVELKRDKMYDIDFLGAYYLSTVEGRLNLMNRGAAAVEAANTHYAAIRKKILEEAT